MKEIKIIKDKFPPIPAGFTLSNMTRFNIIVGENNVGKTRFFEAVDDQYSKELKIVHIKARDVVTTDDQFKESAATSGLISNVVKLFENLNIPIEIKDEPVIKSHLNNLVQSVNDNFARFTTKKDIKILNDIDKSKLKIGPIVQSLFSKFTIVQDGLNEDLKPDQIGQGYQRILIASILKSYVDLYKKFGPKHDKKEKTLILFEEPEMLLHPLLKRELNKSLKEIVETDEDVTIIISTHDPYFLYSNLEEKKIKIYSFRKNKNTTEVPKEDPTDFGNVADESLHIAMFNKVTDLMKKKNLYKGDLGQDMEILSTSMIKILNDKELAKEIKTYSWGGSKNVSAPKYTVLLPIYCRNTIHHGNINSFKNGEVELSVKILSKLIQNLT